MSSDSDADIFDEASFIPTKPKPRPPVQAPAPVESEPLVPAEDQETRRRRERAERLGLKEDDLEQLKRVGVLAKELETEDNDSEDEGMEDYKEGGYHPVFVGECLIGRYVVLQKLGWGHFSTVWLCRDIKFDTYVAIKLQKSASHYLEAAFDEVEILQKVVKHSESHAWFESLRGLDGDDRREYSREDCYTVQLLNAFIYQGPYGKHFCMVFEILGVNLLEIIKRYKYKGIPIHITRKMARQILLGLHYLHSQCGIIHTDLKPENVMMCLSEAELQYIIHHKQLGSNEKANRRMQQLRAKIGIQPRAHAQPDFEKKEKPEQDADEAQSEPKAEEAEAGEGAKLVDKDKVEEAAQRPEADEGDRPEQPETAEQKGQDGPGAGGEHKAGGAEPEEGQEDKEQPGKEQKAEKSDTPDKAEKEEKTGESQEEAVNQPEEAQKEEAKESKDESKPEEPETKPIVISDTVEECNVEEKTEETSDAPTTEKGTAEQPGEGAIAVAKEESAAQTPRFNEDAFDLKVGLGRDFKIKIADLGNGCWTHYHFQPEIQTRQYRGPEVILGINYNQTADLWSFACMIFEMLTGDFLFDPKRSKEFKKNDDHLAQMIELLNEFPPDWCTVGTHSKRYFDRAGKLKKIKTLRFWGLRDILIQRYKFDLQEATALEDFLLPMLRIRPQDRATAAEMVNHYWLDMRSTSFRAKTPVFKHQNDQERFQVIIDAKDAFAAAPDSEAEEEDEADDGFEIKGSLTRPLCQGVQGVRPLLQVSVRGLRGRD